jgi:hypothetical protein
MPGYNSSGTGALLALAKETKDKKIKEELINWLKLASECPYNSPAKIKKKLDLRVGKDPYTDCLTAMMHDWKKKEVIIFWYASDSINTDNFIDVVARANKKLLPRNIQATQNTSFQWFNGDDTTLILLQQNDKSGPVWFS